jgi:hypothetical protein
MGRKMRGCDGMSATWYFCRSCGYRGQFVAEEKETIECPECYKHGRDQSIMRRQDVSWLHVDGAMKEAQG